MLSTPLLTSPPLWCHECRCRLSGAAAAAVSCSWDRAQIHNRPWISLTFALCTPCSAAAHYPCRLLHWCNFIWRSILLNFRHLNPALLSPLKRKKKKTPGKLSALTFLDWEQYKKHLWNLPLVWRFFQPGGKDHIRPKNGIQYNQNCLYSIHWLSV